MVKFVADDKIPFLKGVLEQVGQIDYLPGKAIDKKAVEDAQGLIIRTRTKCSQELLAHSRIQFIASATIGYDHIDTSYCEANDIFWTNAPGCNSSSVQQYIASALVNLARINTFRLRDKVLGIVGVGNVGSKVASFARTVGMPFLLNDPPRARREGMDGFVSLEQLLAESDIITFHVPLEKHGDDKTFHLADQALFDQLKQGAIVINSSRGEVLCGNSLKQNIKSGKLANAVLDVWEEEPNIDRELLDLVTFATPHIAGYSLDGKANGTSMSVQAASRHFQLGLDDWFPETVPTPEQPELTIETAGQSLETILAKAINHSYHIGNDDRRLRQSPETFEKQRGDYPLRREFPAYTVNVDGKDDDPTQSAHVVDVLRKLGFKVVQSTAGNSRGHTG